MLIVLMYMFAGLGVSLLLAAAALQIKQSSSPSRRNKSAQRTASFNFKFPEQYFTPDGSHIIALDGESRKIAVGIYTPGSREVPEPATFPFENILGSEIVENALTLSKVSKTSRITTSTVNRIPVAAAPSGNAAVISATDNTEEINELMLKIYLSDADTPVLSIPFLPGLAPARKSDSVYSQAFSQAERVHELIRGIVSA